MKYAIITKNLCIDRERRLQMSVIHLKKEEFDKEVLECNVPVLVDFWAVRPVPDGRPGGR